MCHNDAWISLNWRESPSHYQIKDNRPRTSANPYRPDFNRFSLASHSNTVRRAAGFCWRNSVGAYRFGPEAIVAFGIVLGPGPLDVPSTKTLVAWVIASKMAVLY